jgi:serine/threonine protein kinase
MVIDCTASVGRFLQLMNLDPLQMAGFVKYLMKPFNPKKPDTGITNLIQMMDKYDDSDPDLQLMRRPDGRAVKGAFGRIIESTTDPSFVWKEIVTIKMDRGKPYFFAQLFLQEALIQFVLADADPSVQFTVPLLDIRSDASGNILYLKMPRASMDLFQFYADNSVNSGGGTLTLPSKLYYDTTKKVLQGLIALNQKFNFVHRDLKSNNVVIFEKPGQDPEFRLIDFGMSCLDLLVEGEIIKFSIPNAAYTPTSDCMPQQDILTLFFEFITTFEDTIQSHSKILRYYAELITPELNDIMEERKDEFNIGQKHIAAYNMNASLSAGPAAYLTPEFALATLEKVYSTGGGRRKRTRRRR